MAGRRRGLDARAGGAALVRGFAALPPPAPRAVVSGFAPVGDEIDVWPLLRHLHAKGHAIALPITVGSDRPLAFRAWSPATVLAIGPFGIPVPPETAPLVTPAYLLAPLLAFDRLGRRLGYGGGYYDRTLKALRDSGAVLAVGVAFAEQEVPEVPDRSGDQRLDWILTDREAIGVSAAGVPTCG
jgi:5-formyltetrahydrofolate cyclo-ligase